MTGSTAAERSILVVEDNDDCRDMLKAIIEMWYPGTTVRTASDGKAGLEQFTAHFPCVVITDLNMPELSGAEMAERMAQLRPQTHIIVLTADADLPGSGWTAGAGVPTPLCLLKPLNFDDLFLAIERCLEGTVTAPDPETRE